MEQRISPLFAIRGLIFIVAFILYVISLFFHSHNLEIMLSGSSILLFITGLIKGGRIYVIMAVTFLLCSIFLSLTKGVSWFQMMSGFTEMTKLILFIGLIPLISAPMENFLDSIQKIIKGMSQKFSSFQMCHLSTFILANITNLAAMPIVKTIFFQDGNELDRKVKSELSIQAYGLAMMCTPIGAAITLAIELTRTNWLSLLSINLIIVIIGLFLSYSLTRKSRLQIVNQKDIEKTPNPATMLPTMPIVEPSSYPALNKEPLFIITEAKGNRDLVPDIVLGKEKIEKQDLYILAIIFGVFGLFFTFLLISEYFFPIGMMEIILISILPFTFLWGLAIKKVGKWWEAVKTQIFSQTPNAFGQFAVIISAGLLTRTIEITKLNEIFMGVLPGKGESSFGFIYIIVTILIIFLLSIVGVHQFVAMIFVAHVINPESFGIAPIIFASTLLVGLTSGMVGSSFSGLVITMSSLLKGVPSYEIARKNYAFVFIFIPISTVILILFNFYLT